jgi:hypothetical protein
MKHFKTVLCLLAAVAWFCSPAFTQEVPNFAPGQYLLGNDKPMMGDNSHSSPEVADWNNDGNKDIMVGVFYNGNIYLYLNEGTDSDPVFGDRTLLEADGEPISVGYG